MDNISYLLIGGNEGDRIAYLTGAREHIEKNAGPILQLSGIYETAAWGKTDQADFLNQVLAIRTQLDAHALMTVLLEIEEKMGRRRAGKYGPRIIDIDILFFNEQVIQEPQLTIPHPEIPNRRFVLAPMAEIAPSFIHPVLGKTILDLLAVCPDKLNVKKISAII
jgi:2-amino-4-hydroxy-6-hydroxymethyldihydropteridine diphosphokinase